MMREVVQDVVWPMGVVLIVRVVVPQVQWAAVWAIVVVLVGLRALQAFVVVSLGVH